MIPQQQPHSHTIVLLITAIQPKLLTALLATFFSLHLDTVNRQSGPVMPERLDQSLHQRLPA